jgi:hypothetical protein
MLEPTLKAPATIPTAMEAVLTATTVMRDMEPLRIKSGITLEEAPMVTATMTTFMMEALLGTKA